jgi:PIN domain nuclease of toxin-antitoxin system
MRLLLDTQVFLWAITGSPRLAAPTRRLLEAAEEVYVSAASVWEIAIKARLGKIDADVDAVASAIESSGFLELPVRGAHAARVAKLPDHHNDPFDRLLVAQALVEPLRLITADAGLARYSDLVVVV